jgi:hypothetical protein
MNSFKIELDMAREAWRQALTAEREALKFYLAAEPEIQWLEKQHWELTHAKRIEAAEAYAALAARSDKAA